MAKNKKPRKKYVPRYATVGFDAVKYVLSGMRLAKREDVDHMRMVIHGSMHALTHGLGNEESWGDVARALNVAEALCIAGHGEDHLDEVLEAVEAHANCGVRKHKTGGFGYTSTELQLVNFAIELHEVQLSELPVIEIEKAVKRVEHVLQHGKNNICITKRFQTGVSS